MTQWVRSESLRGYKQLVSELGGDGEKLIQANGLALDVIETDGLMIPYRKFVSLLEDTAVQLDCSDFGMRFSLRQDFSILGPIALAAQQGDVLEQALQRVVNYIHVYSPGISIGVSELPDRSHFLLTFDILLKPMPLARQANELSIALAAQIVAMLSSGQGEVVKLLLPHGMLNSSVLYKRIFKCPIEFHQGVAGLVLNKNILKLPISGATGELGRVALSYLQSHYLAKEFSLEEKVEALIKPLLMVDQCTNETIANTLNMQVRQLHRSLHLQGTNFVKIKDKVRKFLAEGYLQQEVLNLGQIAGLLGYAEQSAFSRSCRRWFQASPRQVRDKYKARKDGL
ncbi:MAG: AraC family transcriptional regulator ligand-binding domain-containing protein [Bermanella sp.]